MHALSNGVQAKRGAKIATYFSFVLCDICSMFVMVKLTFVYPIEIYYKGLDLSPLFMCGLNLILSDLMAKLDVIPAYRLAENPFPRQRLACRYWKFPKEELLRKYSHSCKFESQVIQTRVEMFTPVHYKFRQSCQPFFRSRIEQSKPIRLRSFLQPPPKRVGIVLLSLTFKSVVCVC